MGCAAGTASVAVEIFGEENQVAEIGIVEDRFAAVDGTAPARVRQEQARHAML